MVGESIVSHAGYEGRRRRALAVVRAGLAAALLSAACSNTQSPTPPTTPTPAVSPTTETFVGTLPVGGARFYSFSIAVSGMVNVTLVSIGRTAVAPDVMVSLGLGTPSGTSCSSSSPATVSAGSTAQVTATEQPGLYCVNIADVGNLPAPADFSITIDHP
jgi:hypothetical protein